VKAITIYQPHATAVALGWKKNETKPGRWHWRGLVAIHAALERHRRGSDIRAKALELLDKGKVVEIPEIPTFPRGAIVALVRMVDCVRAEDVRDLTDLERAFGDYSAGRFVWKFTDVRPLRPIECKGAQGMWDVPADVQRAIYRQISVKA
jgi:hypothetical protein